MVTGLYIAIIFIVNITAVNSLGVDKIPARSIKARIEGNNILLNSEAFSLQNPIFELGSDPFNSQTIVYKILASVPWLGLNIGYKVATLPKRDFTIKSNNAQYTVYDQYNNRELLNFSK